jgi:hypothetical protein
MGIKPAENVTHNLFPKTMDLGTMCSGSIWDFQYSLNNVDYGHGSREIIETICRFGPYESSWRLIIGPRPASDELYIKFD